MRNNNQQKRTRGRNNGNRRSQNPLTRVYESNGPDVKVRGTAQHVVEKYQQLARDAQASGDHVAAENYLQHAEHYYRIIAAAQAQFGVQGQPYQRNDDDEFDDEMDEGGAEPPQAYQVREPQAPRENGYRENGHREGGPRDGQRDFPRDRDNRRDNRERGADRYQDRNQDRNQDRGQDRNQDRHAERGQDRDRGDRPERNEGREGRWSRDNRPYRDNRDNRAPREGGEGGYRDPAQQPQPRLGPDVEAEIGLPAFITQSGGAAPVTPAAPRRSEAPAEATEAKAPEAPIPAAVPVSQPAAESAPAEATAPAAPAPKAPGRSRAAKAAAVPAPEEAPTEDSEARAPRTRRRRYRRADAEGEGEGADTAPAEVAE